MKRLYAIKVYGLGVFPKFYDSYPTLALARSAAKSMLSEGWQTAEIMRDLPRTPGYFGIQREVIETMGASV